MNHQQFALTNAATVDITAGIFCRGVTLEEDGSAPPAGIVLYFPEDGFTLGYEYTSAQQPVGLGTMNPNGGSGLGPIIGVPADGPNPSAPATVYCKAKSIGATSKLNVTEYD